MRKTTISALVVLLFAVRTVPAQDAVRLSLASAQAAEARRNSALAGAYNLKLGPTSWAFGAGLGIEYNDNVNLDTNSSSSDVAFRPQILTKMVWPMTTENVLNLTMSAGYAAYLKNTRYSGFYVAPGSELSFDLYAGDFWLNLHDRPTVTEFAYEDPTIAQTGNYSRLENTLGFTGTWDLNKVQVTLGYDHQNYVPIRGPTNQPNGSAELAYTSATYALWEGLRLGLEAGGGTQRYSDLAPNSGFADADQWNAGAVCDAQLTQYIHFKANVGYTSYLPTSETLVQVSSNEFTHVDNSMSGMYARLSLSHRLNKYVTYTLSGGRSITASFFGGVVDLYEANLDANWNIIRGIGLLTSARWEHGRQTIGISEVFDRYGGGISLSRALSEKLSGSLGYTFYSRTSDIAGRDYQLSVFSLNLTYKF